MAGSKNFLFLKAHADGMLYGFLSLITVGASYHIVPFLLWWKLYAPRMGRESIPTLKAARKYAKGQEQKQSRIGYKSKIKKVPRKKGKNRTQPLKGEVYPD